MFNILFYLLNIKPPIILLLKPQTLAAPALILLIFLIPLTLPLNFIVLIIQIIRLIYLANFF